MQGPATVTERYGVAAIPIELVPEVMSRAGRAGKAWQGKAWQGMTTVPLKTLGKGVDVFRTARWVRRHDVVIVPGMGVLEASLPLQAWENPYAMFVLCVSGRLFGTKVALVSVGADAINKRLTRWLFTSAARLAFYRSYREICRGRRCVSEA